MPPERNNMCTAVFIGVYNISVTDMPVFMLQNETNAIVRVTALQYYNMGNSAVLSNRLRQL
ncbi:uncharacterized protein Z518_00243 [Rhinocladiella mackenziei CBS 650.93]|uniref:Uncharacterized protein n=1 Tax=Rhinocladiella mackenziei CBS 650.93 TaxID=1442369 RepID=A0A0D2JID0_9EURO|nr:uncharacterized protein Z518_00243 [Rhinocladiella mackenziei CBS 650.93]KIX09165.1 hypothetical protein Z518_00243 [Rhinocladiella mackenziei CBS 650.93]